MRIDEDKIFNVYVTSLLEEAKKKGLPPWLKDKKGKKDDDDESEEKTDKKSSKKSDKKKKGLPPWLKGKGKGKKSIKESMDDGLDVDDKRQQVMEYIRDQADESQILEIFEMLMGTEPDISDDDGMTDAEADADTLKSAGMGTDEDYGGVPEA